MVSLARREWSVIAHRFMMCGSLWYNGNYWRLESEIPAMKLILVMMVVVFLPAICIAASVTVSTAAELAAAIESANAGGADTILLQDGLYTLDNMLWVSADHVTVRSVSGNRTAVIIEGQGMTGGVSHIFNVPGSYFTARDMTLRRVANHAVQIHGNAGASNATLQNLVFQDTFEQMVKISYEAGNPNRSSNGLIENCLFEYTAGIGPQYYIGGVDGHYCMNWIVRDNEFHDIQSPESDLAEHAIHFWSDSEGTLVERNLIINCDRGIGFGLGDRGHIGGIIRNNMIYHDSNDTNCDVAIGLENASGVRVYNNTIWYDSSYPNAIEYRFAGSTGVMLANNLCNRAIADRDGASGTESANIESALSSWFVQPAIGDLHLASGIGAVVDQGIDVEGLTDDFDRDSRPFGAGMDIGADEWGATAPGMLQISLLLNQSSYGSGDRFRLDWEGISESGTVTADLYILLEVLGGYWFYPSWTTALGSSSVTVSPGIPTTITVFDFTWPDIDPVGIPIRFYSAVMRTGTFELQSNVASVEATI